MPKSMPLTEFTEASQELAYELCSPGRCDKCLEEEIRKGQAAAMRKEQKKEAQDKMPGKEGSLRRVRKMLQNSKGGDRGQKKKLTLRDGSHAGHMHSFSL